MPPIRGQLLTAHYAMGTGADKPSHPLERFVQPAASSTWNTPGAKGIWGNGIGSLKPRESGSRDSNDAFSKMPTGSSALAATSEAEPNWSPWNNSADTNQGRSASGNTSPNRPRIEPLNHEMNGSGAFYSNTSHQIQPAIGQRSLARPQASSAQGSNGPGAFSVAQFAPYMDEKDDVGGYGESQFSSKQRSSQDGQYALAGALARDPAIPTTSHSESDLHAANAFAGSGYGNHTHNGGPSHSQHASISHSQPGLPFSFVSGQQLDHGEMLDKLNDLNMMDGVPTNPMAANLQSYSNGQGSTAFNPTTLPWGPASQGVAPEFSKDMYYGSPGVERHAYPVDRGSPAGSAYRASLNNSKSYHGTPQQPPDPWAQPASRDPRNGQDPRRAQGHNAQFYSVPYPQQGYPTGPFDPYGGGYRVPMQPMHMGANYAMVPSYLAGPTGPSHPGRAGRDNDPSRDMRSKLLNEFRQTAKSNKRFELPQIYGHIVEFSGDQHGSRFIQEKLETANSDEKDQVFQELQMNAVQLMKDVFGNYVIQKFFEHGNQVQKKVLAGAMKGKVVDLSMQMYACRVVQKALEHVLVEQQAELVKELEPEILKVVKDQNGNHVVQKIIELVPRQHIDFIMNCFKNRVCELSTHGYGCRVIQRVLEHGAEADKVVIMAELHQHAQQLIPDNYGNYVAQHVIRKGSPEDASKMIATVTKDLIHYSKHKFASNVVEKCIEKASVEELRRIREAASVTGPNPEDLSSPLALLIKDQFGNYVIQKLLNQLKGKERQSLVDAIKPIVYPLKSVISKQPASAIDRLINLISTPAPVDNEAPASTAPASPTVQSDDASIPTPPVLTTGPNSPSSSPPSTNDGLAEDTSGRTIANASAKLSSSETVADTSIRLIV